jgi:CelD/BcsL family acetyltransferase involved in cellulose biosynthesis
MSGTEFETITTIDGFAALAEWDELVRSQPRSSPFLLLGWLLPWWRRFGDGRRLAVQVARRDGRLVGALPFYEETRLGVRVAHFLGDKRAEIADLLLAPGEDEQTARELVDRVDAHAIHVFGLPAESRLAAALAPVEVRKVVRAEAPLLRAQGSWEDVVAATMSGQRKRLQRKRLRQLEEHGAVEFVVARTLEELEPALEEAFRLHELRWAGQPDQSGFVTEEGKAFHRDALRALAPTGVPRIASLLLDGRTIGFYYYLALGERVCGADMAYDPAFGRFSPGWLATLHMLEVAIGDGAREVEFLGGTEEYKTQMTDELAPLHEALARPRTPLARLYVEGTLGALAARRRLKESERVRKLYYDGLAPLRRRIASR